MSDTIPIPPDTPIAVTLPAMAWNTVLQVLGEGPYRVVNPLIGDIQRQCIAQMQQRETTPEHMPQRVNGGAAAEDARNG